jgi:hypothetical protein
MSAIGYLLLGELFADAGRKDKSMESLNKAEVLYLDMKVTPKSYWLTSIQNTRAKLK